MNMTMSIARIRRLVLVIVRAPEAGGFPVHSSSVSVGSAVRRQSAGPDVGSGRIPWVTEMAAPSFMILSARPPRR